MKTIAIFTLLILTGCGTIISHQAGSKYTVEEINIYQGMNADLCIINDYRVKTPMKIMAAFDLPLSFIADTILLPVEGATMFARVGTNVED